MEYVILDLEFNQPYKFRGRIYTNNKCRFEIMEIGAVKLDEKFNIIDSFRIYVKNCIYKYINPFVESKIHITVNDLKYGFHFHKGYKEFKKWSKGCLIFAWGDDDARVFRENCDYHNIKNNMVFKNLQKIIGRIFFNNDTPSLISTIDNFNINTNKHHHWALDDAYMAAYILQQVNRNKELKIKIKEWIIDYNNKIEINKKLIEMDKRKIKVYCDYCGKSIKRDVAYCKDGVYQLYGHCSFCKNIYKKVIVQYEKENNYIIKKLNSSSSQLKKRLKMCAKNKEKIPYIKHYHNNKIIINYEVNKKIENIISFKELLEKLIS